MARSYPQLQPLLPLFCGQKRRRMPQPRECGSEAKLWFDDHWIHRRNSQVAIRGLAATLAEKVLDHLCWDLSRRLCGPMATDAGVDTQLQLQGAPFKVSADLAAVAGHCGRQQGMDGWGPRQERKRESTASGVEGGGGASGSSSEPAYETPVGVHHAMAIPLQRPCHHHQTRTSMAADSVASSCEVGLYSSSFSSSPGCNG